MMHTESLQRCQSGFDSGQLPGAASNTILISPQQEHSEQLVHCDAANAVTKYMTQDALFKIVHKTARSKNAKKHEVGCEYNGNEEYDRQLTVWHIAGVRRELCDQFIDARYGN